MVCSPLCVTLLAYASGAWLASISWQFNRIYASLCVGRWGLVDLVCCAEHCATTHTNSSSARIGRSRAAGLASSVLTRLSVLLLTRAWVLWAVYQDGTLCLDIIQNKWSPSYTVSSVLTSIQSLLTDPNCGSPANPEAAELFTQDKKAYNRRVRRLTEESLGGA